MERKGRRGRAASPGKATAGYLVELYAKGLNPAEIGEIVGLTQHAVRYRLKKAGVAFRGKSQARKLSLDKGRSVLPDKASPVEISRGVSSAWARVSPEVRAVRAACAKQHWHGQSPEQLESLQKSAAEGIRRAAVEGSSLEKHILTGLRKAGYKVHKHARIVLRKGEMHVDILIEGLKRPVALEVNGPSHYLPIYGPEALSKRRFADSTKAGLLWESGIILVSLVHLDKSLTLAKKNDYVKQVLSLLEVISHGTNEKQFTVWRSGYSCGRIEPDGLRPNGDSGAGG